VIGMLMMYVQSGRRVSIYTLAALSRRARDDCGGTPVRVTGNDAHSGIRAARICMLA
jgi:hypothetical protein